jgi:hypothetical protein
MNAFAPPLGLASSFAVLAGTGITIAGAVNSSHITGDIGTYPTPTETGLGNLVLTGVNHADDPTTAAAKVDLITAYLVAAAQNAFTIPTELGGTTLPSGVYTSAAGTFTITGTLTLDGGGDPNAVFIFQAASTLITASSSNVVLINGAQACNCFWQVGSSATLGTSSNLLGTVLALTSITLNTSATASGRMLARNGAVTFDTNTVAVCSLAAASGSAAGAAISKLLNSPTGACLMCLSEKELKAIMVYAMRTYAKMTLAQLLVNSACYRCLSKKQMLVALTGMITKQLVPGMSASDLRKAVRCSACGSDKHVEADLLYLFQTYFQTTAV